jgi:hypothetical protein
MRSVAAVALLKRARNFGSSFVQTQPESARKKPSSRQAREDLARARKYGDQLKTFLAASNTGAIGILLATAGSLAGKDVSPNWVTVPVGIFAANLVLFAISLIVGEHRSLLRRRNRDAQEQMPIWKMAITWNIVVLLVFVVGICASVVALRGINLPTSNLGNAPVEQPMKGSELHPTAPPREQIGVRPDPSLGPFDSKPVTPEQNRPAVSVVPPQKKGDESAPAQGK